MDAGSGRTPVMMMMMRVVMMMMMMMGTTMKTQPESEVGSWCAVLPQAIQESLAIH